MRMLVVALAALVAACTNPASDDATASGEATPEASPGSEVLPPAQAVDRPCDLASVVGLWSLIHIEAAEPGVMDFYRRAPNEYMRIQPDGAYAYFATPMAVGDVAEINTRMDQVDAADGVNDVADLRQAGLLVVVRNGQPFQAFNCVIAGRDQGEARAGDMVWTQMQGMPGLYRVQRRLQ